jgi:5'-nucleotidase
MRILVSNDDGYFSPASRCSPSGWHRWARSPWWRPERDRSAPRTRSRWTGRSGAARGQRLSLRERHADRLRASGVTGWSTVARHRGLRHQLGANMGDDTIYSAPSPPRPRATCSASRRSRCRWSARRDSISNCGRVARADGRALCARAHQQPVLLNVNVPDIALAELGGIEATRLGRRHKAEPVVKMQTPRGETAYWIGAAAASQDAARAPTSTRSPPAAFR